MHSAQDYDCSAETPMENDGKDAIVEEGGDRDNMFECGMCEYKDRSLANVNLHKQHFTHTKDKHHCTHCSYSTSKRGMLYKHKKIHVKYSCEKCDFAHNRKERLRLHMISHEEERSFICKICKKALKHASSLTKHTNSHNVSYPCNKCGKTYKYPDQLTRHKATIHKVGQVKMHHCEHCAYESYRGDRVRDHIRRKHPHA